MSLNLTPWLKSLWITDKQAQKVRFDPNWAQRQIIAEIEKAHSESRPARLMILKARQLGVSTLACGLGFSWATLFDNTSALVASHTSGSTIYLFDKVRYFHDTWSPELKRHYPTRYSSRRELAFSSNNSFVRVQTAKNPDALRTRTLTFCHGSETAFWDRQEESMIALKSAIPNLPGTVLMLESTANGLGNWWEQTYREAEAGKVDFVPMFFPWFTHYEYIPCHGLKCKDATCDVCESASKIRPQDDEEKRLVKLGCDMAHLAWRRWAIPNVTFGSEDFFHQEMPATADEAFLVSGVNVFPEAWLKQVYEKAPPAVGRLVVRGDGKVDFVKDPRGPLRVFKPPADDPSWGTYFIGADPCHGTIDGDFAAAQVINRQTKEQVAVWHGRINPIAFADELVKLGRWYNEAVLSVEVDGPGMATVGRLTGLYQNLWHHRLMDRLPGNQRSNVQIGWSSNWKRKQWLISQLADSVQREEVTIHDHPTYNEMRGYAFYGDRGDVYGPSGNDQHDDLVMALGIAVVCERTESPVPPYEMRPGPRGKDSAIVFGEKLDVNDLMDQWN